VAADAAASAEYERLRRRRRAGRARERRRRAARRRRNALLVAAAVSLVLGAVTGAGGAGGGEAVDAGTPPGAVPILMYHVLGSPPPGNAYPQLFVKNSAFEAELDWLDRRGYEAITLDQLYQAWQGEARAPPHPVVISFDDGYRSQYSEGLPALEDLGWPAVLDLKVDSLTQGELTDDEVSEMLDAGWEVDSHTIHHLDVSELGGRELQQEVAGSREILQKRFGAPVDFFCYPAGRSDPEAVHAVKAAGYLGATTTAEGLARSDDLYSLKRIRVDASDGVKGLAAKLSAAGA
jgi:peptidoglycan/xylan/chitin deacetylase (PgdA/CDA1 family)